MPHPLAERLSHTLNKREHGSSSAGLRLDIDAQLHACGLGLFGDSYEGAFRFLIAFVDSCSYALIAKTLNGEVVFWNKAAERIYGYSTEEMLKRNVSTLVPTGRLHELTDTLNQVREGRTVHKRTSRLTKAGVEIEVITDVSPIQGEDGHIVGAWTVTHDTSDVESYVVHARKAKEEGVKLRRVFDVFGANAPVGLGYVDKELRIEFINEALAAVAGATVKEIQGRTVPEAAPDIWPQMEPYYRQVLDDGISVTNVEMEGELGSLPGQPHRWIANYYPIHRGNDVAGVGVITVDVTERRHAEIARNQMLSGIIDALAVATEIRDPYTAGHQRHVAEIAVGICRELGLSEEETEGIRVASTVHDIGKIGIPSEILTKPGRLNAPEWELMKCHPRTGYDLLTSIPFVWPVATMVLQHHERLDGTGYPMGLKGDEILQGARILAVADVVEAMSTHRPYRAALGRAAAIEAVTMGRGTLFDPNVVDAMIRIDQARVGAT